MKITGLDTINTIPFSEVEGVFLWEGRAYAKIADPYIKKDTNAIYLSKNALAYIGQYIKVIPVSATLHVGPKEAKPLTFGDLADGDLFVYKGPYGYAFSGSDRVLKRTTDDNYDCRCQQTDKGFYVDGGAHIVKV